MSAGLSPTPAPHHTPSGPAPRRPGQTLLARAVPHLGIAAYLALITALAQASGQPLLLFPELGALTSVAMLDPGNAWMRSPRLLVITPLLTAAVGLALSSQLVYGPLPVALVVAISLLLIQVLRSPVTPALSAGLLPLALGLRSWLYPAALLPGTLGLALLLLVRRRRHSPASAGIPPRPAVPARPQRLAAGLPPLRHWLPALVLFLAGALLLVHLFASPLVLYPPLLVLSFETLAHGDQVPWRERPLALLGATTGAAVIGLLLQQSLAPGPLVTLLAALLTSLLLGCLRLRCPPAYAAALLPFVIAAPTAAYPLHVLVGTTWLVVVAALSAGLRRRRADRECRQ